jgi:hypothetical protein
MFNPDPDLDFYPSWIPDPGVKKAPDPGSATLILTRNSYIHHVARCVDNGRGNLVPYTDTINPMYTPIW